MRLGKTAGKILSLTRLSLLLPEAGSQLHLIRIIRRRSAPRYEDDAYKKQDSFHVTHCFTTALATGHCFFGGRQRRSVALDFLIFVPVCDLKPALRPPAQGRANFRVPKLWLLLSLTCLVHYAQAGTIWIDTDVSIGSPIREVDDAFALSLPLGAGGFGLCF